MRVLYSGQSGCDFKTLKRLTLVADDIAFMDYPSVMFGNWGMVGHDSWFRRVQSAPNDPVRISVHTAPGGPPSELLQRYLGPDVADPGFRDAFLEGLSDPRFASKFIQLGGDYVTSSGIVKGSEIVSALQADGSLREEALELQGEMGNPETAFDLTTREGRKRILARELMTASVHVTAAMITSEESGAVPVSDEPYFGRLIALRAGTRSYVGDQARMTPYLGLEIMRAVIPDDVLEHLSIGDIMNYRAQTADAYRAWMTELDEVAARTEDMDLETLPVELPRFLAAEVHPRVQAYRNELRSVRDNLFGGIIKDLPSWRLPTFSLVAATGCGLPAALAWFAGSAACALPHVADYYIARRRARRSHPISYVVGVSPELGSQWDEDAGVLRHEF